MAVAIGLVITTAPAEAKKKPKPTKPPATTTTTVKKLEGYPIGTKGKTSDLAAIAYGKQEPYLSSNQFAKAAAGNHFVAVDVEVFNPTSSQHAFSSLLSFKLVDTRIVSTT